MSFPLRFFCLIVMLLQHRLPSNHFRLVYDFIYITVEKITVFRVQYTSRVIDTQYGSYPSLMLVSLENRFCEFCQEALVYIWTLECEGNYIALQYWITESILVEFPPNFLLKCPTHISESFHDSKYLWYIHNKLLSINGGRRLLIERRPCVSHKKKLDNSCMYKFEYILWFFNTF